MKTLFLGSYGFGNLGDELCLIEAMNAFPSTEAWAFTNDPDLTARWVPNLKGFIRKRAEVEALKPDRVVLGGGGVGFFPSIRDSLHWMDDAFRLGAECHIHNIGVSWMDDLSWTKAIEVQRVLGGLASCSVRDDMSRFCIQSWPAELRVKITYYPERLLPLDGSLEISFPAGRKLLGVSITGQKLMGLALARNKATMSAVLDGYRDYAVVPIVSTVSATDNEEDDIAGFNGFKDLFLSGFDIAGEEFLNRSWWRNSLTPLRLKSVIGGLDTLITQRKHNLIHAIGTQTHAIGVFPAIDDSIARIFFTLRDKMPLRSYQVALST
jgi:hypothetical protein